jgi:hypothetical protein
MVCSMEKTRNVLPASSGVEGKPAEAGEEPQRVVPCLAYSSPSEDGGDLFSQSLTGITMQKTSNLHNECCETLRSIRCLYIYYEAVMC